MLLCGVILELCLGGMWKNMHTEVKARCQIYFASGGLGMWIGEPSKKSKYTFW